MRVGVCLRVCVFQHVHCVFCVVECERMKDKKKLGKRIEENEEKEKKKKKIFLDFFILLSFNFINRIWQNYPYTI